MLNAFRHQRKELCPPARPLFQKLAVLNAFRHQRKELSASLVASSMSDLCSTPFGINGRTQAREPNYGILQGVLNAFRHQRKELGRNGGIVSIPTGVLNAFRHQRKELLLAHGGRGPCFARAQRLSASTEGTRLVQLPSRFRAGVLNAFRHQRKELFKLTALPKARKSAQRLSASTEGTQPASLSPWAVASCAQRLSASTEGTQPASLSPWAVASCAQRLSASTEGTQAATAMASEAGQVLNAFRHQRKELHVAAVR